ncbi:MAG: macrolide ABC transporter ATP-binding protein [Chloroflexi bacterium]|nr:macrolide ABC transporter ATP-binding protein [Chloroflexota bacterium]|tara:strand:+ start:580 stop:1269 length:690 start_codon:yes stop_codon:yes gene_type:complete
MNNNENILIFANQISRNFELTGETINAVKNVTLKIFKNKFTIISGRSGAGKTTLLNMISGIDQPSEGEILFEGKNLADFSEKQLTELRKTTLGIVFQSFSLLPLLSAYENIELPLRINGVNSKKRKDRTLELLNLVGLSHRESHRPYELSGGEQQRVAIARALSTNPSVLIADEPTGQLDSNNTENIFNILENMVKDYGTTVILTTHDIRMMSYADNLFEINSGILTKI